MRKDVVVDVSVANRAGLEAIVADQNSPQKHVWRARVILLTAAGLGTVEIARSAGKSKKCVWRWQERFMQERVAGLLRDKTRPSRIPPLGAEVAEEVVALTQTDPPGETTHWTAGMMAKAVGISISSVQRIWRVHGLQPHRVRQFKLSTDPEFAAKVRDIVGLYVDPPARAIVLSVDEKSQIQALDRTQPGLPRKKGLAGTMTHDYQRNGTTTPFAVLDVLEGRVIGRCMQRHRHQEFIRFLNAIEVEVLAGKIVHVILYNYGPPKHPKTRAWPIAIPASCSTTRRPRARGSHHRRRQARAPSVRFAPLGFPLGNQCGDREGAGCEYRQKGASAQGPEIASLPLAMTIGWTEFYLILMGREMGLSRNFWFGKINSWLRHANSRFDCCGNCPQRSDLPGCFPGGMAVEQGKSTKFPVQRE
jgi:transposase